MIEQIEANTLWAPIAWEQIEPEGKFAFSFVDTLLGQAREHDVRLVKPLTMRLMRCSDRTGMPAGLPQRDQEKEWRHPRRNAAKFLGSEAGSDDTGDAPVGIRPAVARMEDRTSDVQDRARVERIDAQHANLVWFVMSTRTEPPSIAPAGRRSSGAPERTSVIKLPNSRKKNPAPCRGSTTFVSPRPLGGRVTLDVY